MIIGVQADYRSVRAGNDDDRILSAIHDGDMCCSGRPADLEQSLSVNPLLDQTPPQAVTVRIPAHRPEKDDLAAEPCSRDRLVEPLAAGDRAEGGAEDRLSGEGSPGLLDDEV